MIEDLWVESGNAETHYLRGGDAPSLTPLVYMPGLLTEAESFRVEIERLAPRVVIAAGRRGVGKSSAPRTGYSLDHQVADFKAVVEHANPGPFCAMAFSTGVPIVLEYAVRHPQRIRGLILLDYLARYSQPSQGWVDQVLARGTGIPEHVVHAVRQEAEDTTLWDRIEGLACPTLVIRGGRRDARLTPEDAQRYLHSVPNAQVELYENAGHEVYKPDYQRFIRTVSTFLTELDDRSNRARSE